MGGPAARCGWRLFGPWAAGDPPVATAFCGRRARRRHRARGAVLRGPRARYGAVHGRWAAPWPGSLTRRSHHEDRARLNSTVCCRGDLGRQLDGLGVASDLEHVEPDDLLAARLRRTFAGRLLPGTDAH